MVFVALTRGGFDAIAPRVLVGTDAVWVNGGVLSEAEAARLRASGWNLTTWTYPLDDDAIADELDNVRLHQPRQIIWVETRSAGKAP